MKQRINFLLFISFTCISHILATTVISVSDNDWNNPSSWSSNTIPVNPDTIIIRHYITYSQNLTINAPTVLIIESEGTLCGDYLLDILCGAKVLNYGHWYVNALKIRMGFNYNEFYFKITSSVTAIGCSSPATVESGFYNVPPLGHINTWTPALCKSSGTNWPKSITSIPGNGTLEEFSIVVSPNPINSGYLTVAAKGEFGIRLYDTRGALMYTNTATDRDAIDMHDYPNGIYFVAVTYKNKQVFRKVFIDK